MKNTDFSLEFEIDDRVLYKFNCDYFKRMYGKKIRILFLLALLPFIFVSINNINTSNDLARWLIMSAIVVFLFLLFHSLFVSLICRILVSRDSNVLDYERFVGNYRYSFTESNIYVHSPFGFFVHKWSQLDRVVLTRQYLLLYITEKKGYIISRSESKCKNNRKMNELIYLIENNAGGLIRI